MEILVYIIGITIGFYLSLPVLALAGTGFVLEGILFTRLYREKHVDFAWSIWLPYICILGKTYFMSQMSDATDFRLFNKTIVFKKRMTPFWIYLGLFAMQTLISIGFLLFSWIPFLGTLVFILYFLISVPSISVICLIEFSYFRDMLNYFNPDQPAINRTKAALVTVGNLFTYGLLRAIYLYRFAKLKQSEASEIVTSTVD